MLALEENVDPIGSCVGQRGARIQTIIAELGGEKVDIIEYSDDPQIFIAHALAPAKVVSVNIQEEGRQAVVRVGADQLSLAIGRGGQNVRLAAKLTGWRIDVKEAEASTGAKDESSEAKTENESTAKDDNMEKKKKGDEESIEDEGEEKTGKKEDETEK